MYFDMPYLIIYLGLVALGIYIRVFIKSTVEKSVGHQFDIRLEKFKQDFAREMATLEHKDKFRLAAIDKRLDAHQMAFALSRTISENYHSDIGSDRRKNTQDKINQYWDNYSLYLGKDVRVAMANAIFAFNNNREFLHLRRELKDDVKAYSKLNRDIIQNFEYVTSLPKIILESIDLEAIANEKNLWDSPKTPE